MRVSVVALALVALATPAAAQSTYVGASLLFDLARYDRAEYDQPGLTFDLLSLDGETLGLGLQVGRTLGERWGVEFEFARSGEIENRNSRGVPLLAEVATFPVPDFAYEFATTHRTTSYSALGWVRQDLGDRVDLTFLGGVAFNRIEVAQGIDITDDRLAQWISILPNITGIEYATAPAVGVQAGFKVSESAAITAGMRMHGASALGRGGWRLRPNVGVRWSF